MSKINFLKSGLIYRNPKPHVRSVHAYFPSVVYMANGELLASIVLGETFEAVNLQTHFCRSTDGGETWTLEKAIDCSVPGKLTSNATRITSLPDGEVLAFMIRSDRSEHPDEGLTNSANLGFAPTDLLLARSSDFGRTWNRPELIKPPLVGPAFELCCPILPLKDGRLILPTETWHGWDGYCPNGIKMVAFVSRDCGNTWPEYMDVMNEKNGKVGGVFFWESKIAELPDGRLLAVAWVYDDNARKDRPNHYAISKNGGKNWTPPLSMGLQGQTLTPLILDEGRILCVYRRMDKPGLWANISHLEGDHWINEAELSLWGHQTLGLTAASPDMAHNFNVLRFGAPAVIRLLDGTILVAFWCYEDCVSNIRWFKLSVE